MTIHRGTTFMYLQYSCPFIYHFLPNVWKTLYTTSMSIFVDVPYWQFYSTDTFISVCVSKALDLTTKSSLVFYQVPHSGSFTWAERSLITWTHVGWVWWMFQNLPFPVAQEVRDSSSGVTPCIVMKNDGVLHHQVLHAIPENIPVYYDLVPLQFWSRNAALVL